MKASEDQPGLLHGGGGLAKGRNRKKIVPWKTDAQKAGVRRKNAQKTDVRRRNAQKPDSRRKNAKNADSRRKSAQNTDIRRKNAGRKRGPAKVARFDSSRRPLNLNIGMMVFGVIFIYVVVCVIIYFQTSHIVRYEVKEGSLATDTIYRGIALREETVVRAETAGYVNYYAREGERVAKNNLVYLVDEAGRLRDQLESLDLGENSLSDKELAEFRTDIVNFVHGFDPTRFGDAYEFKHSLKNTVLKLANASMLRSLTTARGTPGGSDVSYFYAPDTGIVTYWTDGYEALDAQSVTEAVWAEEGYQKELLTGNSLVAAGDPVYKLSTSEDWSLVIPIDAERGAQLQEEGYVKVRFLKNQYESWGEVKLLSNADGGSYLQLGFTNSMVTFATDRFLDIELIVEDEQGLKIPVSSIVEKEFFLIPEAFVIPGGSNGGDSIIRQTFLEDGSLSSEAAEVGVYHFDSQSREYYLDSSLLSAGDNLYRLDSQETFTVSKRATLIGVYNINKGYAEFKQITIQYQNDEYAIVKPNTKYGLRVYDYIVLDAKSVRDDQLIRQRTGQEAAKGGKE